MSKQQLTALIMAGGTGGHIFPGIAVANELIKRNWKISWLGSKGGMEEELVSKQDIELHLISISGLRGNGLIGWLKAPFRLTKAVIDSIKILKRQTPSIVIGFGGFASGPGGLAAFLTGTPLIIHEQNAVAGLTNRVLSKIAKMTFEGFPNAFNVEKKNIKTIGNPVRKEILALNKRELNWVKENKSINILVVGGSRGALALNQHLPKVFAELAKNNLLAVKHQVGRNRLVETQAFYDLSGFNNVTLNEFVDDMAEAFCWADLVICRAGASTVSEVAASGVCAVFIPYPYAVDDHQTANAQWLVKQNAARSFSESDLQQTTIVEEINNLINTPEMMIKIRKTAKRMAYINAASEVADYCVQHSVNKLGKKAA
jgi:UDP-N-acetylglucosamine--N-acetylmuramyl-(pentapeptide) pyrophosphoryl-undecaprenol N-acetylglucosamine transferase